MNLFNFVVYIMAVWIAFFEGYFLDDSLAKRNNNPGNLRSWGGRPTREGFAYFSTPREGWEALFKQVAKNINRGLTLLEFFAGKPGVYPGYAPASDGNDPWGYAHFISKKTGIPVVNIPIIDVIRGN